MSTKLAACIAALTALDAAGKCPTRAELLAKLNLDLPAPPNGVTLPPGCVLANIPGAPGLVYLTDLPAGTMYSADADAIDEVRQCFPKDSPEDKFLGPNIDNANTLSMFSFMGTFQPACMPVDPSTGRAKGANIPGTRAWPSRDRNEDPLTPTVASVVDWLEKLKPGQQTVVFSPSNQ